MGKKRPAKTPPIEIPAQPRTEPRRAPAVPGANTSHERICWRFNLADPEGPWALKADVWPEVIGHLTHFETMTADEIFAGMGTKGKRYEIPNGFPAKEANRRWAALGLDDQNFVWRLGDGGPIRIYGLRVDNVFHVLWWDPKHEIWPSRSKWSGGRWVRA